MNGSVNLVNEPKYFGLTTLNGPGLRYAFWVQGCSIRCTTDCLNPEALEITPNVLVAVEDLVDHILERKSRSSIEGITILGGEPFDQAESLAEVARRVKEYGLSVVTYSGHTLEFIQTKARPGWSALLAATDILIDGPFKFGLKSNTLHWRGSSNQRLIFLSERYSREDIENRPLEKGINLTYYPGGKLGITGAQDKGELKLLVATLRERGWIE